MSYTNAVKVAAIVRDAGGRIVGRTRLQKVAYLLSIAGLEEGLPFTYKHYGPYSEDLASAARDARLTRFNARDRGAGVLGDVFDLCRR